jgi:hypothetical protein
MGERGRGRTGAHGQGPAAARGGGGRRLGRAPAAVATLTVATPALVSTHCFKKTRATSLLRVVVLYSALTASGNAAETLGVRLGVM